MKTMFKRLLAAIVVACGLTTMLGSSSSFAAEPRAVPPNMIGLMLTPTGFNDQIFSPGQVDIGNESWSGYGNKLILIQRSGFQIKEQFVRNDPKNPNDREDHRCIVGPNREPMTLDVRLLFALPDYTKPDGKGALLRMGLLGNPVPAQGLGTRVLVLPASSVYKEMVQQQVRGKIRQVCASYPSVEDVYKAVEDKSDKGFAGTLKREVAVALVENQVPLRLVEAVPSNVKPDPAVVNATVAILAAEKSLQAMKKIDDFIKEDKTGTRQYIYKMYTIEAMGRANEKGQNSTFLFDTTGGQQILPVPQR